MYHSVVLNIAWCNIYTEIDNVVNNNTNDNKNNTIMANI